MASRKNNSSFSKNNNTMIIIVIALVLFALGYVVGRVKAKLSLVDDQTAWRQTMMTDRTYQQQFLDSMMKFDDSRKLMFSTVDTYRKTMMGR